MIADLILAVATFLLTAYEVQATIRRRDHSDRPVHGIRTMNRSWTYTALACMYSVFYSRVGLDVFLSVLVGLVSPLILVGGFVELHRRRGGELSPGDTEYGPDPKEDH